MEALKPVYQDMEADYLDIGTPEAPRVEPMRFFTALEEHTRALTVERRYVGDKNRAKITCGYQSSFPIRLDEYKNDAVCDFIRDVAEEQQVGVHRAYYRVRLHQPADEPNRYYCRRFVVGFAIDSVARIDGEIKRIEGTMNAIGGAEIGVFDTVTREFTPQ